jgi:hypothetical protein
MHVFSASPYLSFPLFAVLTGVGIAFQGGLLRRTGGARKTRNERKKSGGEPG